MALKTKIVGRRDIGRFFTEFNEDVMIESVKPAIIESAEMVKTEVQYRLKRQFYMDRGDKVLKGGYSNEDIDRIRNYAESIYVDSSGDIISVTFPRDEFTDDGIPLHILSSQLEYGTSKSPPKPHWRPTFLKMRSNISSFKEKIISVFVKNMNSWSRSNGFGGVKKV